MMAKFLLTPCRIREDRMVPDAEPVALDWGSLTKLLAPSKSQQALMTLRRMKVQSYVGLVKQTDGRITNFLILNDDRSNSLRFVLKRYPDISTRIQALYRVDEALFDSKVQEISSGAAI